MQPKDRRLVTEKNLETHTEAELEPVKASIANANTTSSQAYTIALSAHTQSGQANQQSGQANQKSDNAIDRVEHIETMAGLAPGEVTDAQTANLLHQSDSSTRAALGEAMAVEIGTEGSAGADAIKSRIKPVSHQGVLPLRDGVITTPTTFPLGVIRGVLYGANSTMLRRIEADGTTWSDVQVLPESNPVKIFDAGDGEVLLATNSTIYRSEGWSDDPGTAIFTGTRTVTPGSRHTTFNVAVDPSSGRCLAAEYSTNYANSRNVHFSSDHGRTWEVVYRIEDHAADPDQTHLHLTAVDPWNNGRLYLSWHHRQSAHPGRGVFYSDDDGSTWHPLADTLSIKQPTVGVPTDSGMVWGTDESHGGVYVTPRNLPTGEEVYVRAWAWRGVTSDLLGFAHDAWRDPDTGIVYMGFVAYDYARPVIVASDGVTASLIWEGEELASHSTRGAVAVTGAGGKLFVELTNGDPVERSLLTASIPAIGVQDALGWDRGRVSGGRAEGTYATASGPDAVAAGLRSAAFGIRSTAGGADSTAVGNEASANASSSTVVGSGAIADGGLGTTIGASSRTGTQATAMGGQARSGLQSFAAGQGAEARARDVALGYRALTNDGFDGPSGGDSVAIGHQATASTGATSIGAGSEAAVGETIAIGRNAKATHARSIAIGTGTETTETNQFTIGDRFIDIQEQTRVPAPPSATARLHTYVRPSGKTALFVRFPTGDAVLIAEEP